jgi:hypothetical protein
LYFCTSSFSFVVLDRRKGIKKLELKAANTTLVVHGEFGSRQLVQQKVPANLESYDEMQKSPGIDKEGDIIESDISKYILGHHSC